MEKVGAMLTLFILLPVVLGANPHRDLCQEKETLCKMSSGNYGCCPAANGVCCVDGDHCCPSGFKCDLSAKQCLQYGDPALYILTEEILDVVPVGEAGPRIIREVMDGVTVEKTINRIEQLKPLGDDVKNVTCPGGGYCDDDNTCCMGTDGDYKCCSLPDANCCDDYFHCCPSGTICDTANSKCITPSQNGLDKVPFVHEVKKGMAIQKVISRSEQVNTLRGDVKDVQCPDKSSCPDGQTCCVHISGGYACCSDPNANCCDDYVSCCPSGQVCDVANGKCITPSNEVFDRIPFLAAKPPANRRL